jgi:chromosome segregation ATPase
VNPEWNEKVALLLNPIVDMINIDIKGNRRSKLGSVQIQIDRTTPFRGKEVWYNFGEESQILIEQVYAPLTLTNTFSEKYVNLTAQLEETLVNQEASDDEKIAALTGQVEVLKGEKESEKQVYEETIANLRKEIEEKNKTMEEMQDDLEEFMKQVEELEDDVEELEDNVEELEEENEKLEKKNNESLSKKAADTGRKAKQALKNQGKKLGKFFRRR